MMHSFEDLKDATSSSVMPASTLSVPLVKAAARNFPLGENATALPSSLSYIRMIKSLRSS